MSELSDRLHDHLGKTDFAMGETADPPQTAATDPPPKRVLRVLETTKLRKNTLRGFCTTRLPNGFVIRDNVVGESGGSRWVLLPSKAMLDRDGNTLRDHDGKVRYAPVIEANKALRDEYSRRVVTLLEADYPEIFDPRLPGVS